MTEEKPGRKLKFIIASAPDGYRLPSRPSETAGPAQDTYRQTQFLLGADLALLERAMDLQARIAAGNRRSRSLEASAMLGIWSRSFLYLADCCTLALRGAYISCPPLLRNTCECVAAQRQLVAEEFADYREWFTNAMGQDRKRQALSIALGPLRPGPALAREPRLGPLYRLLTELSAPHFGSSVLQTAPDSGLERLTLAFGSSAFHLGWAELILGWLLLLCAEQLETVVGSGVLAVDESLAAEAGKSKTEIEDTLRSQKRCHVVVDGDQMVFYNFRRNASSLPRRIVLQ